MQVQQQEKDLWCWAAVTATTAAFYGNVAWSRQCDVARGVLGIATCCSAHPVSNACNQEASLRDALTRAGHLRRYGPRSAAFRQVAVAIEATALVAVRVEWNVGGAHFVLLTGYRDGIVQSVDISDPLTGEWPGFPFSDFPTLFDGGGRWTDSYWTS